MLQAKKNNSYFDFIIVGQGIAGATLALSLLQAGYNIMVINQPYLSLSSRVAAGIWNPIVFKRLTKSWLADDLIPELLSFYQFWEKELQASFIEHRAIIKPFTEEQEKKLWLKKSSDNTDENIFLDKSIYHDLPLSKSYTINSYSKVLQAGNLNVNCFLDTTINYLKQHHSYLEEEFNYNQLSITPENITYKNINAKHIVFCEGHLISKNPYFNWVPMKPAKGDTLIIESEDITLTKDIFNKGFFMMPLGSQQFKVGATYEWNNLNDEPTEKGKAELIKKINSVTSLPYKIISHDAGVRPSVIDRRPVIGTHPEIKNAFVFNGLGTKAVMIAPYFAKQFVNYLKYAGALDADVNINRFGKP